MFFFLRYFLHAGNNIMLFLNNRIQLENNSNNSLREKKEAKQD